MPKTAQTSILVLLMLVSQSCGPTSDLKGQSNTAITFYGKCVDQDGNPLSGVTLTYRVEAYPKDWTFNMRGRPNDVSMISVTSAEDGSFLLKATGCTIRCTKADRSGYRHFCDEDRSGSAANNYFYTFIAWSDLWYKSDPDHPAVYVFVKDGVTKVSALPCRGGFEFGGGNQWIENKPAWPKEPSLPDVRSQRRTAPRQHDSASFISCGGYRRASAQGH